VANDRRKLVAALLGNPKLSTSEHALESPSFTCRTKMVPPHPNDLAATVIKEAGDIMEILELARGKRNRLLRPRVSKATKLQSLLPNDRGP
jgi:hypothetical protein